MSTLQLTPGQLQTLAEVLTKLSEITGDTGIRFDAYGTWDIEYADNMIRVGMGSDGEYRIDHYCQ